MPIRLMVLMLFSFSILSAEDYSLEKLCKIGIKNNPQIKSIKHKTAASNSYYEQSIDQYKPHASIDGQVAYQNYNLEYTTGEQIFEGVSHQYQFSLRQPVYNANLLNSITDAKERVALAKLVEEDEKAKHITQILQNTFELKRLQKTIDILDQKEKILKKAYANIEKKHVLKLASKVDQYQALSMLQKSRSDLVMAKQTYDHTLFNLKMLTKYDNVEKHIEPLSFNIKTLSKDFQKVNIPAIKMKYHQNTRVKLDQQTVKIAEVQIDLRGSERYPKVDAVLSYGDSGGTIDATVRQNDSRAMLTLNFPLYQGGYVSDRIEEARYLYLAAKEETENSIMNIKILLEKKIQDIRSGLESIKADTAAVQSSKKYFEATTQSYKNGLGSLTDVYLAEAEYHDMKLKLIASKANVFISLAEAYYYSGMTDYQHVRELQNKYLNIS